MCYTWGSKLTDNKQFIGELNGERAKVNEVIKVYYELQPLRISAGWKIQYNNFTEYDIGVHGSNDSFELNEDLLQLYNEKANLIIDLGWYPSHNIDGNYLLLLVKDYKWDCPLEQITSKSKREIIACIEKWTCYGFFAKYCNR